jgi:hypothetical protein
MLLFLGKLSVPRVNYNDLYLCQAMMYLQRSYQKYFIYYLTYVVATLNAAADVYFLKSYYTEWF